MNPLKLPHGNCSGENCRDSPFWCRYDHTNGTEIKDTDNIGKTKYYCPYEWEISAVKSKT